MALSDILGPIRRRWYLLLLGLLLTVGGAWATWVIAPSQYTARGLVMLLPSEQTTGPRGNPLLNLGGLDLPARVLIAYYGSEPVRSDLERYAPKADARVTMEESTRGPIIAVDVKDATPEGAMTVLHHLVDSIPQNLARIQREVGTPARAAIGSLPLVLDAEAEHDNSLAIRLVVAAASAGVALTFFSVFSVDGIILRRRARADDLPGGNDDISDALAEVGEPVDDGSTSTADGGVQPLTPQEGAQAPSDSPDASPAPTETRRTADEAGTNAARRARPSATTPEEDPDRTGHDLSEGASPTRAAQQASAQALTNSGAPTTSNAMA